ncbi:MAG: glycosyltransferase [Candidatus Electrothrix aestuarii]|uniref:Glycosyltransferase n=1 Tax=Candidatus Electrothrix aestuarii TaxID=3062594 RepID=A0AAU8LY16_9BACT|nr:glycosyltransferase [Candidatus Electrothrix aestuarii]
MPKITGVICTHNREQYLQRCIESLYEQTLDQAQYEVLVVDNGSTDTTAEICRKFEHLPNFRYVFEPVLGLSQARNTGWKNSQGAYVGYLDDDAVAEKTWFEKALWSFENIDPSPEWVGGPIDLEWEVEAPCWITGEYKVTLGWLNWGEEARFLTEPSERLGGGNSFYQRATLESMQGFDTRLGRKKKLLLSGEETQFQHRLKATGGRLYYHPGILIHHFVPKERTAPSFFYKRYYWGGITDYLMSRTLQNISFEAIAQEEEGGSSLLRLFVHTWKALGFFVRDEEKIQGRIYLTYVIGWVWAAIRYRWEDLSGLKGEKESYGS